MEGYLNYKHTLIELFELKEALNRNDLKIYQNNIELISGRSN